MSKFERREWAAGDQAPGASDLNRIEQGIDSAHDGIASAHQAIASIQVAADVTADTARLKELEYLADNAKVADIVVAYNGLLRALRGEVEDGDNTD